MIPIIGVMIGLYICFRALDVLCRKDGSKFMPIVAILLIVATVMLMADLIYNSNTVPTP